MSEEQNIIEGIQEYQSTMGRIIDLPLEDFKKELIRQQVNVGVMNNLILNLEAIYNDLRVRKDSILNLVHKGIRNKEEMEVRKSLEGLYAEMTKIEIKVTYLKEKVRELLDLGLTTLN